MTSNAQHRAPPPRISLDTLLQHANDEIQAINEYDGPLVDLLEDEPITGELYTQFLQDNNLSALTNLSTNSINNLFQTMQPFLASAGTRGPRPKSSPMDQLICYLVWGRTGEDVDVLARLLGIKSNRLEDNLRRIRPILNQTLKSKWWDTRMRPRIQVDSQFPHVALLVDGHTSKVFRPKVPFEEAKPYFDKKNKIYGLKNEVAVMVSPPHYCMFVSPKTIGSVHDFQIFKDHYERYLSYLLKLPEENMHLPGDVRFRYWAIIADKAYVGPPEDTPDVRRITPKKGELTQNERAQNQRISVFRVPVEQFFGRVLQLWAVPRNTYRMDHKNFQMDFENWCLLTNEHILVFISLCPLSFFVYISFLGLTNNSVIYS